ncbi:MAG: DUF1302 domain-containing protein [Parvibaculum sp.]|uniref:DUF1302 domain-containing protein n=1 Tax=Parvibaculum sp. TaxID=2024848 RepID=UPI003C739105
MRERIHFITGLCRPYIAFVAAIMIACPAAATEFTFGEINFSLDNTASIGASIRTSHQSCEQISVYNGGCRAANGTDYDVNSDDGNVNVERGELISAPLKIISELGAKWQNYGVFIRAKAFWDPATYDLGKGNGNYGPIAATTPQRRNLRDAFRGDDAYNRELRQLKLLDAFAYGNFNIFDDMPLNVRVGRQVVNWGESLFIQGGVSSYLPLDVAAFTKPGTELKEVFLPQATLYASLGLPANFTFEAMYIAEWERDPLPPCGTFFSPSDALTDGCGYALSSGEFYSNADGSPRSTSGLSDPLFLPRGASQMARNQGQWGAALRYFADWLNQGTDLGVYFVNFHDKLPIGTFRSNSNQLALSTVALLSGGNMNSPVCTTAATTDEAGLPTSLCAAAEGLDARSSGKYLIAQHPEDVHMIGGSFNTTINIMNGTALSGDMAYYTNMPFQLDTTELVGADFQNAGFTAQPGEAPLYQGAAVTPGDIIPGYRRTKALVGQTYTLSTFTPSNFLVNAADADLLILVANAGFQYLPDASGNRFAVPRSGETHVNPGMAAILGDACIGLGTCSLTPQYASSFSWGYRMLAMMQYNSFLGSPYTVSPRVFFAHDVKGYSAGPIGPGFVEGVKTVGLGVDLDFKSVYKLSVDYSSSFGSKYRNAMYDKDFAAASLSYTF